MNNDDIINLSDRINARSPEDIIENDGTPEGICEAISKALSADDGRSFNSDRPYNGQPHTDLGARGMFPVSGVTVRDIGDCLSLGLLLASGKGEPYSKASDGKAVMGDLYKIDLSDIDIRAAIQNAMCELEKRMGVYPNIP